MMSYTIECTSLCDSGGMLMRFMSPSTRIIGGTPEDRCRSEALFLTANARSCAMSTAIDAPWDRVAGALQQAGLLVSAGAAAVERGGAPAHNVRGPQNFTQH